MVVFHFKAFTSECSFTPGHGSVIFLPASATKLCTCTFVTSVNGKDGQNKIKLFENSQIQFATSMLYSLLSNKYSYNSYTNGIFIWLCE